MPAGMTLPELWYEPSDTRDMAARERARAGHTGILGIAVLVMLLVVVVLLVADR